MTQHSVVPNALLHMISLHNPPSEGERWPEDLRTNLFPTAMARPSRCENYAGYVLLAFVFSTLIASFGLTLWAISHVLPVWAIVSGILMLCIYNFDSLPLQDYWNPMVRELDPNRQWHFEQTVMRSLHQMNVIPVPRTIKNYSERLPSELWSIVLAHVVDIPFFFDTACEAKSFNLFIVKQAYNISHLEYQKSEKDRVRLRLVCRGWAYLLEQYTMRFVQSQHEWREAGNLLSRADFNITALEREIKSPNPQALAESIGAPPKQATSLKILVIRRDPDPDPSTNTIHEFFRGTLVRHAKEFTGIQSLVFGHEPTMPAYHLLDIQQSFSHLTFLQLEGDIAHGILTLERLDILRLNVMPISIRQWWFPSLRHLALGEKYLLNRELDLGLIPAVTERLLSLLLPVTHAPIRADQSFWTRLASLRFLGVALCSFILVDDPPPSHPLTHFCLAEAHSDKTLGRAKIDISEINSRRFIEVTRRLPSLKLVTIPTVLEARRDRYPTEWRSLSRVHRNTGIKWVDEFGKPIDALRRVEDRRPKRWEDLLFYGAGCYLLFVAKILPWIFTLSDNYSLLLSSPALMAVAVHWLWGMYDSYRA